MALAFGFVSSFQVLASILLVIEIQIQLQIQIQIDLVGTVGKKIPAELAPLMCAYQRLYFLRYATGNHRIIFP